jgi:PAS domain S-box-containing protein
MATPLTVLILEDRPADAELMIHELKAAGFALNWRRVDNETDYLSSLDERPEIILADHNLPQFDAKQALLLLKQRGWDIPLIIVTGSISEEVAVTRMKEGAADYLLKDRLTRLGPAVVHALEEKRLREVDRRARDLTARLAAIIESSNDAIIGADNLGNISVWNPAAEKLFGYTRREAIGCSFTMLTPPERTEEMFDVIAKTRRGESVSAFETERLDKYGKLITVAISVSPLKDGAGNIIGSSEIVRDLTARKQNEKQLAEYVEQLRALNHGITRAKEDEAKRIALQLHDEAGQMLAAVHIGLSQLVGAVPEKYRDALKEIEKHLITVEDQLRTIAHDLRPAILDQLGLQAALETLTSRISARYGIQVWLQVAKYLRFPADVEIAIYRIAQESLNNVAKHSHATTALVRIDQDEENIDFSIHDNGVGFDTSRVFSSSNGRGLGLIGIRERLQDFRGTLHIDSAPGRGTTLTATIPLMSQKAPLRETTFLAR